MDKVYDLLQKIKSNPKIYLGRPSLDLLYAFINGYKYERDIHDFNCLNGFQQFIEKKYCTEEYNLGINHNWADIIQFFSMYNDKNAFYQFYEDLENFIKKEYLKSDDF